MVEGKLKGALEIAFAILIAAGVFYFSSSIIALGNLGYAGVFIISLLSSATIFIPAPGWAVVIALSKMLNPFLVGIIAGLGSGLGEITGYIAGNGAKNAIADERFAKFRETIGKNDTVAIFLLAFIPNPVFDIAGIAAGSLGIPVWRFLIPCILGRVLRYVVLAYTGAFVQDFLYL